MLANILFKICFDLHNQLQSEVSIHLVQRGKGVKIIFWGARPIIPKEIVCLPSAYSPGHIVYSAYSPGHIVYSAYNPEHIVYMQCLLTALGTLCTVHDDFTVSKSSLLVSSVTRVLTFHFLEV